MRPIGASLEQVIKARSHGGSENAGQAAENSTRTVSPGTGYEGIGNILSQTPATPTAPAVVAQKPAGSSEPSIGASQPSAGAGIHAAPTVSPQSELVNQPEFSRVLETS